MNPKDKVHNYDFVIGVMSGSNPADLFLNYRKGNINKKHLKEALKKWNSMEQVSLHNQKICDKLRVRRIILVDEGKELDANEYNRHI